LDTNSGLRRSTWSLDSWRNCVLSYKIGQQNVACPLLWCVKRHDTKDYWLQDF
jgi:hypothetical protein